MFPKLIAFLFSISALSPAIVYTQTTHFTFTSNTGNSATVGVPLSANPNIDGVSLQEGDEIGVFTPDGLCVGGVVWNGQSNVAITVWGNNALTPEIDGMRSGEEMFYRVWRKESATEVESVDVEYELGDGIYMVGGIYRIRSMDAYSAPAAPSLIFPEQNAQDLPTTVEFRWSVPAGNISGYDLQVSLNEEFTDLDINESGIDTNSFLAENLRLSRRYFWRVRAINAAGTGGWSAPRSFTTVIAPPETPALSSPDNGASGISITPTLRWIKSMDAETYRIQLAGDPSFTSPVFDQAGITDTSFTLSSPLQNETQYFWRIRAVNAGGASDWSVVRNFTTVVAAPLIPILAFPPDEATGISATPTLTWNASSGAVSYRVQVADHTNFGSPFFDRTGVTGTSVTVVPALQSGTLYYWRVRASNEGGESNWSETRSFETGVARDTLVIPLEATWNMISSYIRPSDSRMEVVFGDINDPSLFVKDREGDVYWPETDINTIEHWDVRESYQIYLEHPDTLVIVGTVIDPRQNPIVLTRGWNYPAFFSAIPLAVDRAFTSIYDRVVLMKTHDGFLFWPEFNYDTIELLQPGRGYQVYLRESAQLYYPDYENDRVADKIVSGSEYNEHFQPERYLPRYTNTGESAVMLVRNYSLHSGDEIGVWDEGGMLIGSGVVRDGKSVIVVWGNNSRTYDVKEGGNPGERLRLTGWSADQNREFPLRITAINNIVEETGINDTLRYVADGIFIIETELLTLPEGRPVNYTLFQNYPNPFNPSTAIRYSIPDDVRVQLAVYNMLGQTVAVLVDEMKSAGYYETMFQADDLPSGIYFVHLRAGYYIQSVKMTLVK
jgi:hypothetical protein